MLKKILIGCMAILLAACLCIPGSAAPAQPDYSKIVELSVRYDAGGYTVTSSEAEYGKAPNLDLRSGSLTGTITDSSGRVLKTFSMQEPGAAYGDILTNTGDGIIGYTESSRAGTMVVTIPYIPGMNSFGLSATGSGTVLATADLNAPIATFCADYPLDPDCQARAATPTQAQQEAAPAGLPLYLILAIVLSVSAVMAAVLAIATIRKRAAPEKGAAPKKKTILIVDDNPDIVDMLHLLLERKGYLTLMAQSGKECLEIMKQQIPDLVLLDIMMEPMDGWETLTEIRKMKDPKALPVLMLTAKRLTAQEARQYRLLMNDYLQKPTEPAELYSAVEFFLDRKEKLNETLSLAKQAGVERSKVCELAQLSHGLTINRKLLDILHVPQAVPVAADLDMLDTMSVADYITTKSKDNERRISELRSEINTSFRTRGLPELNW